MAELHCSAHKVGKGSEDLIPAFPAHVWGTKKQSCKVMVLFRHANPAGAAQTCKSKIRGRNKLGYPRLETYTCSVWGGSLQHPSQQDVATCWKLFPTEAVWSRSLMTNEGQATGACPRVAKHGGDAYPKQQDR